MSVYVGVNYLKDSVCFLNSKFQVFNLQYLLAAHKVMDWEFTPKRVPHAEIAKTLWSTVKDGIPEKFKFPMGFNHHDIFTCIIILF